MVNRAVRHGQPADKVGVFGVDGAEGRQDTALRPADGFRYLAPFGDFPPVPRREPAFPALGQEQYPGCRRRNEREDKEQGGGGAAFRQPPELLPALPETFPVLFVMSPSLQ